MPESAFSTRVLTSGILFLKSLSEAIVAKPVILDILLFYFWYLSIKSSITN